MDTLQSQGHTLGAVIDLTFTARYYSPTEFKQKGVHHEKIFVPGHDVPKNKIVKEYVCHYLFQLFIEKIDVLVVN